LFLFELISLRVSGPLTAVHPIPSRLKRVTGKAQRLKQAKQEAEAEIQKMTQQAETTFKNKELQHDGASDESFVRINKDKQEKIAQLDASVAANKAEVCRDSMLVVSLSMVSSSPC
jgi:hypothetical protein